MIRRWLRWFSNRHNRLRRQQCRRCRYSPFCLSSDNKLHMLQFIIGHKKAPDTECKMRERISRTPIYPGMTWEEIGKRIGEYVNEGFPVREDA